MKKIIYVLSFIFVIICVAISSLYLTSRRVPEITLIVKEHGAPVSNQRFYAQNLQLTYDKIKTGEFTDEDTSTKQWKKALTFFTEKSPSNDEIIHVSSSLRFGPGVTNSDEETREIIQCLPLEFVQEMSEVNGMEVGMVSFHQPGNVGKAYTNEEGIGKTELALGWTAIYHKEKKEHFLKFVMLESVEDVIELELTNPSQLVTTKITNLEKESQTKNGIYTIEYGQTINYQIEIDSSFLSEGVKLKIELPINLVIDNISENSTLILDEKSLDTTSLQDIDDSMSEKMNVALQTLDNLANENSFAYHQIEIAPSNQDFIINIEAHIEPIVLIEKSVIVELNGEENPLSFYKKAYEPYPIISSQNNTGLDRNYSLAVTVQKENNQEISTKTTPVGSTGINFLTYDTEKEKAAKGASFVLGKKVNGKTYLWDEKKSWKKVDDDLSTVDLSSFREISAGSTYVFNSEELQELPKNNSNWSYSSEDNDLSQSVIQIMGLGQGEDYFLYQTQAAENLTENNIRTNFQVYRKTEDESYNAKMTTSLGEAEVEDFTNNLRLPRYIAGKNEFNLLSVNNNFLKEIGPSKLSIIRTITIIGLILCILSFLVILKIK
ncbi:MAG: hypothetical protein ACK5LM_01305 [Lactovum sp.]